MLNPTHNKYVSFLFISGSHTGSKTLKGDPCLHQKHCLLLGHTLHILTSLMQSDDVSFEDLDPKVRDAVSMAAQCDGKDKDKVRG